MGILEYLGLKKPPRGRTPGGSYPDDDMMAKTKGKGTISAIVTRADGTVEDLGVIAEVSKET